jgi:chromosome segregation ATPase
MGNVKMKREYLILIIIFLCGVAGFSVYRYLGINKDLGHKKKQIIDLQDRNRAISDSLEKQVALKAQLARDKEALKQEIDINKQKLNQLKLELVESRQDLADLVRVSEEFKRINQDLRQKQEDLMAKIEGLSRQKDALLAKLSSVEELRQIIRDLKGTKTPNRQSLGQNKTEDIKQGNRGYVVYRGRSTYRPQLSIQVKPAN